VKSLHSKRLLGALAALAYLPLLWSSPGKVSADTKTYLYLDPSKLLARAPYLWDEHIGFGTVTHQNIGYLFPMGPYYWVMDRLGVPDWIAQRLWLGTLLFAAGAGIVYLCRTLAWTGRGIGVAAVAYMLSPYIFDYAARLSAILLPWAGLGWLLSFTILSVREGGWRWPARFAFTVAAVGGVNATSLVLIGLAPAWWIIHALAVRAVRLSLALRAIGRIGLLTVPVSLWWMAGLLLQGRYGIPILRYTETYEAVSRASTVPEVLLRLGQGGTVGNGRTAIHAVVVAATHIVRHRRPRAAGRRNGALARARLCRRPSRHRRGGGLGRAPLRPSHVVRWRHQALHRVGSGHGVAVHATSSSADLAGAGALPRRWRKSSRRALRPIWKLRSPCGCRALVRQRADVPPRSHLYAVAASVGDSPDLLDRRGTVVVGWRCEHASLGDTRQRLC
jgi:Alpha-(1->3)-arabinofuranosyltransferase